MKRRIPAIFRAVTLVAVLILYGLSITLPAEAILFASETDAFSLDMAVKADVQDPTRLDVVITVKGIQQELDAVEFVLDFDESCIQGLITEHGEAMDAFMTVKPMYTLSISGMEIPTSRYEQICAYDAKEGRYICRFLDKLRYASAKPGESYNGLINDGDLVITVPFKIKEDAVTTAWTEFVTANVKGTTRKTISGVNGTGDRLRVQIAEEIPETTPAITEPTEDTTVDSVVPDQKPNEGGLNPTEPIVTTPEVVAPGDLLPLPEPDQGMTTPADPLPPPITSSADQPVESPALPEASGEIEVTVSVDIDTDLEIMPVPQESTGEQDQQYDTEPDQAPSTDNNEKEEPSQAPKLLIFTVITVLLLAVIVCVALILWKRRK